MVAVMSERSGRSHLGPPAAAYLSGFVFLGLASTFSGPALSTLRDRVGTDDAGIGLIFVGSSIGYVIGSLLAGRLVDRGHGHRWWSIAIVVALAAVAVVTVLTSLVVMVAVFAVLGFMLGSCDATGNTVVLWARPDEPGPLLHGLHLSFAVGALLAPLAVNRALAWSGELWPLLIPLGLLGAFGVFELLGRPAPERTRVAPTHPGARRARTGQVAAICVFFVIYVGVETGVAGWIHTYVEQIGYGGAGTATGVTATFWTGFVCGRVAAIDISRRIPPSQMLAASLALLIITSVVFVVVAGPGMWLWVVVFVIGLVIAPQFAAMIAFAEEHLALSGGSTSAFIAAAGLGGLTLPWLLGVLFDAHGAEVLPPVVLISACLCALSAGLAAWLVLRGGGPAATGQRPPVTSTNAPVT